MQAIDRPRGDWTTKLHALTDVVGRPYALMLTAGTISGVKAALLERASCVCYLLADKGYDADRLRRSLRKAGAVPVIPGRRNRKRTIHYGKLAADFLQAQPSPPLWPSGREYVRTLVSKPTGFDQSRLWVTKVQGC